MARNPPGERRSRPAAADPGGRQVTRSYAQIVTAIWRDDEFRALTVAEQHLYLLLTTQPDISAAGVLHLAVTRWAGRASDTKPDDIVRTLDGLAARRFVVV